MNGGVRGWSRVGLIAAALAVVIGGAAAGAAVVSGGAPTRAGASTQAGASTRAGASSHGTVVAAPDCGGGAPKVTVTGKGSVTITPNLLNLSLDVHTTSSEASTALSQNSTVTASVLQALSSGGVAKRDLQTTDLTIEPNYADTGRKVTGYAVDDTVDAKIRRFATAGTLLDAAVAAGGNDTSIESLSFSLTRPLRAQAHARTVAVHRAVSHARAIAASAGDKVTGICEIHDVTSTSTTSPPPIEFRAVASANGAPAPLESGSQTVTARVTMVFGLR